MSGISSIIDTQCKLCGVSAELQMSHVIPKFIIQWFKETSSTGHIRKGENPNLRVQDGPKFLWLCSSCEQRFSKWEKQFADHVFYPLKGEECHLTEYRKWMIKFCVSLSWRVLHKFLQEDDLAEYHKDHVAEIYAAEARWKDFLNDKIDSPGLYTQHFFCFTPTKSSSITEELPANINRYLLRAIETDIAFGKNVGYVYTKIGRFVVLGFIKMDTPSMWSDTKIRVNRGYVGQKNRSMPRYFGTYLLERAKYAWGLNKNTSDIQSKKIENAISSRLDRVISSEYLEALQHDINLFGQENVFFNDKN